MVTALAVLVAAAAPASDVPIAATLPPVEASFVNMMLAGPVQWFVLRRTRPFTQNDARQVVDVVLAGLWRTQPDLMPESSSSD